MRQDARSLLEKLSRKEFAYKEFADPFADMELWPIFTALLTDERVTGDRSPTLRAADVQIQARTAQADSDMAVPGPAMPPASVAPKAGLFSRYANSAPPPKPRGDVVNMRKFLGNLSDRS